MEWIKPEDKLPPAKEGCKHSERVLVWYEGSEHTVESYGIAYYNYDPPFSNPGFTNFSNYNRKPTLWTPIESPTK